MSKRRESTSRIKRRQLREEQQQQGPLPTWGWYAIGGVVAVLLIAGLFWLDSSSTRRRNNPAIDIEGAQIFPDPGAGHVEGDIDYSSPVPAGGQHNPVWQNCGIYDEPIRAENAVHSLEHGAVWIAYQPNLPEAEVEQLKELIRNERSRLRTFYLLAPNEEIQVPIIATAWRAQLEVESAFDDRLLEFMQRFHIGTFTPERGAACTGGVGEPS